MLKIGITGGIGSGKTTACKVFEKIGIPVYYADSRAKKLMVEHSEIRTELSTLFGEEIYTPQNELDRKKLAKLLFGNNAALQKVNKIVHPRVQSDFENWTQLHTSAPYVLKEAAILFESGAHKGVDKSILVFAPELLRLERVTKRDKTSIEAVRARMQHQLPDSEKLKMADFVLYNNDEQLLFPQILDLHQKLQNNM